MSKGSVAVQIAGQEYRIRSDADPESLHRLAAYVDRAMGRVRDGTGAVDSLDVAVLTCLNLAREILGLREERDASGEDDRLRELIERVESVLDESGPSGTLEGLVPESDEGEGPSPSTGEGARTLELPSVETLRERTAAEEPAPESSDEMSQARMAAGGHERVS